MNPTNAIEAYKYINSRYTFTEEHYPLLKKLTDDEKIWFAVNHGLSHIGKSIRHVREFERLHYGMGLDLEFRKYGIKLLTNVIKLAESVGITADEFAELSARDTPEYSRLSTVINIMTEELDTMCEAFDHGKPLNRKELRRSVVKAWQSILSSVVAFNDAKVSLSLQQAYGMIPEYMVSK